MTFEGTHTALVTPFRRDGTLDLDALDALIEWQLESGVDGLVPCGSTGESATLSHAEHHQVIRRVVERVDGRAQVIAGTGSNSTREAVDLTREAREAGADGALLISPYYNKPTQEGIYLHYRTVAEETGLPLVLYNIPGRTASRVDPATTARLSRVQGIVGLKEAGGDLGQTAETIRLSEPGFTLLSGDDALLLPILALGGHGSITTTGNVAPREMCELTKAYRSGEVEKARELHYRLLPLMEALFLESNPIPVKAALAIMGRLPESGLRLPLTAIRKENRDRLEQALRDLELA